jgi:anthranilate phosphoribosyltransferase
MAGEASPAQIGALLMGLAQKGETTEEIEGAAAAMREAALLVETSRERVIDCCGTGGSGIPRRNVSTAVAIAVAACGGAVAKHGNRAASSRSGSADVLEALGVNIEASPETVGRCIDELGVGFLFARALHPAMRHAGPVRRDLGFRTIFNLLGPLCNPAKVDRQLMGVFDPTRIEDIARALRGLGSKRAFVVHGFAEGVEPGLASAPGIDDLSPDGVSWAFEVRGDAIMEHHLRPGDAGVEVHRLSDLSGGDPLQNAEAMRELFAGAPGAYRESVRYAGALALLAASDDEIDSLPEKAKLIGEVLSNGRAAGVLARLVDYSHGRTP